LLGALLPSHHALLVAACVTKDGSKIVERGELRLDLERHSCTWKNEPVTLTASEFFILEALASRPGVVKSRNALIGAAYEGDTYIDERTIDSHVKRLRRKFKARDSEFDMVQTVYGIGYSFKEV
jgi:two-component system, OmpR family, response regulator ChvI